MTKWSNITDSNGELAVKLINQAESQNQRSGLTYSEMRRMLDKQYPEVYWEEIDETLSYGVDTASSNVVFVAFDYFGNTTSHIIAYEQWRTMISPDLFKNYISNKLARAIDARSRRA